MKIIDRIKKELEDSIKERQDEPKNENLYDFDDEMSPISEMVLSSRTLKLDLDVNKSNSVLILFARIEELLRGITTDVKELLRTHERSVKIISDSVEIMDAMLR